MKRKTIGIGMGALLGVLLLVLGGIWYYVQTSAFMDKVESTASTAASEALGVPVADLFREGASLEAQDPSHARLVDFARRAHLSRAQVERFVAVGAAMFRHHQNNNQSP